MEIEKTTIDDQEVPVDIFASDLKKPTEQDTQTHQQPPPTPQPPPPVNNAPSGGGNAGNNNTPPANDTGKQNASIMDDSDFMAWAAVETADVGVNFACQMISGEANPELFQTQKSNRDRLQQVASGIFEKYKVQISPWWALAAVSAITFAPPVQAAMKIKGVKKAATPGTKAATSATEPKRGPGAPTKAERELKATLEKIKKK